MRGGVRHYCTAGAGPRWASAANPRRAGPYLGPKPHPAAGFPQLLTLMSFFSRVARVALVATVGLLLAAPAQAQKSKTKTKGANASYPAAAGFDVAGSDAKAVAIADRVMREMGGHEAWQNARYFGWSFFGGQYQLWDKYTGDFHWEKDTLVANYNLNTKQGRVYSRGQDVSASPAGQKVLDRLTPIWINNSYWLLMPFKLKDSGVTLT